ncbi:zinc ABC transporter substrate-binding protein [Solemya velesiana gill symbiont]|uniref:High-affinity zinc uptake system protein ZnuA n=1 Tax=Solemya velesiana gill symbiont TaxID=1918948 RepID=A0A1T2KSN9_9GAMM|nr:zinc ABC transporter substrate-binding protein [Solemya velesiana gill symbiont]OOZ35720.1 hypothetical protein BOW51_10690 [Solemya velesiana gill symbiont]
MGSTSLILRIAIIAIALLLQPCSVLAKAPRVLVSIKPVHSLVAGVMEGVDTPELLISGGESPHAFSLRPSDARKINQAKLIFWIGEELETPLEHILENQKSDSRIIELIATEGVNLIPMREGGVWESHLHHDEHEKEEHHHNANPHIWLSPKNAALIVRIAQQELGRLDPGNKAIYLQNAGAIQARLKVLDSEIREKTLAIRSTPFIVFHDAYPYYEQQYGLNAVGSVTVSPEHMPGAKRVHKLRAKIKSLGASCVFSEPQFQPKLAHTITRGTGTENGILDPLGAELPADTDTYFRLMRNLTDALVDCLRQNQVEQ